MKTTGHQKVNNPCNRFDGWLSQSQCLRGSGLRQCSIALYSMLSWHLKIIICFLHSTRLSLSVDYNKYISSRIFTTTKPSTIPTMHQNLQPSTRKLVLRFCKWLFLVRVPPSVCFWSFFEQMIRIKNLNYFRCYVVKLTWQKITIIYSSYSSLGIAVNLLNNAVDA